MILVSPGLFWGIFLLQYPYMDAILISDMNIMSRGA